MRKEINYELVAWIILASVCFGFWQSSIWAGAFMFFALDSGLTVLSNVASRVGWS
jgi:hypothetical protein